MNHIYTPESAAAVARLFTVAPQARPTKAALAALIAEAFVSGMTTQERLSCGSAEA